MYSAIYSGGLTFFISSGSIGPPKPLKSLTFVVYIYNQITSIVMCSTYFVFLSLRHDCCEAVLKRLLVSLQPVELPTVSRIDQTYLTLICNPFQDVNIALIVRISLKLKTFDLFNQLSKVTRAPFGQLFKSSLHLLSLDVRVCLEFGLTLHPLPRQLPSLKVEDYIDDAL